MMKPATPILLYGVEKSGHSHRALLMMRLLGVPVEFHHVDLVAGEQRSAAFLALNPFGKVPVINDRGTIVADSVAILVYLALKYDPARTWLPADPVQAAAVQHWLSAAQGPLFNGPVAARGVTLFGAPLDYDRAKRVAEDFFPVLDSALAGRSFLVGDGPTIADVALYSYVVVAPEGRLSLEPYQEIRAWLRRVEALPGFEAMPRSEVPLAA